MLYDRYTSLRQKYLYAGCSIQNYNRRKKSLKISKGPTEVVNRRRTDKINKKKNKTTNNITQKTNRAKKGKKRKKKKVNSGAPEG